MKYLYKEHMYYINGSQYGVDERISVPRDHSLNPIAVQLWRTRMFMCLQQRLELYHCYPFPLLPANLDFGMSCMWKFEQSLGSVEQQVLERPVNE